MYPPDEASEIFTVCCVLHNILQKNGEQYEESDFHMDNENNDLGDGSANLLASGEVIRSSLVEYVQRELRTS